MHASEYGNSILKLIVVLNNKIFHMDFNVNWKRITITN